MTSGIPVSRRKADPEAIREDLSHVWCDVSNRGVHSRQAMRVNEMVAKSEIIARAFLLAVALVTYAAAVAGSVVCRCVTRRLTDLTDRVCLQRYSDF
ncbi:hypothetical protein [Mycobacteroides abscessus]|uniref:hypothetical protein n=1 Tax=Mycobacteroides abscessus TaxID=36809 RepID=UPI0005E629FD|nr:hypothetical protein [Mycobacteroides abscessus]CPS43818.1 Uncharacterised protein [Mycobacteroides abscessus]CPS45643.1 Uncharacterised protein [Mycobacteroides abscessus]CPS54685.1 Uncharacterised protein [Mycobacteroides abscessus]CPT37512.1 Uncharacterised protein [Mycobacteroides abscessus]CPT64544.1 Uncharacterised protein [Mycobacteroides abscessus]